MHLVMLTVILSSTFLEREKGIYLYNTIFVSWVISLGDMLPNNLDELRVICEMDLCGVKHAVRCGEG